MLFAFLLLCVLSTLLFKDNLAPMLSSDLSQYTYDSTSLIVTWYDPVSSLTQLVLLTKFLSITGVLVSSIYIFVKLPANSSIVNWACITLSGIIFLIHFISIGSTSEFVYFLKKFKISYMIGITSYPLVVYYFIVLLLALIMIIIILWELRVVKRRTLLSAK